MRHTAAQLGATIGDRLRINASAAFRGLQRRRAAAEGAAATGGREGLEGAAVAEEVGERGLVVSGETLPQGRRRAQGRGEVHPEELRPPGGSSLRPESISRREVGEEARQREAAPRRRGGSGSREQVRGVDRDGVEYYGLLQSRAKRWQLEARLWVMSWVFWVAEVLQGLADRGVPGAALLA